MLLQYTYELLYEVLRSPCNSPSPASPSPFPSPFHTSLFPSTRDQTIYAYEHSIKNSSSEIVECSTPSLHKHQALSTEISRTTHHSCGSFVLLSAAARRRQLLNAQGPKPCRCAPCKPRLSAAPTAPTAPHHTTETTTTTNRGWPSSID